MQISKGEIAIYNGPDTSDTSIRAAGFALETAAHLTYLAISSFVKNHLPVDRQQPVVQRANELGEEKRKLAKTSIERWGTEDPFPGQWKL